jgi:hypothetical protein
MPNGAVLREAQEEVDRPFCQMSGSTTTAIFKNFLSTQNAAFWCNLIFFKPQFKY